MPYEIKIMDGNSGIEVRYHGSVDFNQRIQALSDVAEIMRRGQVAQRVLVDRIEIESQLRTMEDFNFGVKLAKTRELWNVRIAILRKPDDEFVDVVAQNRGSMIKGFSIRDEALQWLFCRQGPQKQ